MPPDEQLAAADGWLAYARSVVAVAHACCDRPEILGWAIAFHCQRAVEKAFKGAMVARGVEPPRTHDLVRLEELLVGMGLRTPHALNDLDRLTPFAIDDKYPKIKLHSVSREAAISMIPTAELAVKWLSALLAAQPT